MLSRSDTVGGVAPKEVAATLKTAGSLWPIVASPLGIVTADVRLVADPGEVSEVFVRAARFGKAGEARSPVVPFAPPLVVIPGSSDAPRSCPTGTSNKVVERRDTCGVRHSAVSSASKLEARDSGGICGSFAGEYHSWPRRPTPLTALCGCEYGVVPLPFIFLW